jgi:hypothetical protein
MTCAQPPGAGLFRRRTIVSAGPGTVLAGVEDDFHHFELRLHHDGRHVTGVDVNAPRTPWSLCASAGRQLQLLVGQALGTDVHRRAGLPDALSQCTHQLELALLAVAQAARGGRRQYDIVVTDREGCTVRPVVMADGTIGLSSRHPDGRAHASLELDGHRVLSWHIVGETITSAGRFEGQNLRRVAAWARAEALAGRLDDEALEAVRVLRRGAHVASGRLAPLDLIDRASQHPPVLGACYALQPERAEHALRHKGSSRDFSASGETLLSNLGDWR